MRLHSFAAFGITSLLALPAYAAPISVDAFGDPWEVFHYRNSSGPNSVGFFEQDALIFGAVNVVPNGKGEDNGTVVSDTETTAIARQGTVERAMRDIPTPINPNQFATGVSYDSALTGSWEFEFSNGGDTLTVQSPAVGDAPSLDRVRNMRIVSGADTTTPTFAWDAAAGAQQYTVSIYDLRQRDETGFAQRIFVRGAGAALNFTIPETWTTASGETFSLEEDGLYSIEIQSRINRTEGTNPSGTSQAGAALSIGRTFFDFSLVELPDEGDLFLPVVDTNTNGNPIFNFDNPVLAEQISFYDPFVAIGYDYQLGAGNPFFNSFILPEIGDDMFELHLWDGTDYVFDSNVMAGTEYFLADMTDRFRILGIETGAMLDPTDPSAFVTGLSFVSDGQFTGTMTPISVFVDDPAPVPLPAAFWGLIIGIGSLATTKRRARRG